MTSDAAARNRARFPYASDRVDHLRGIFGDGVRLMHATRDGDELGEAQPVGVVATQTWVEPVVKAPRGRS